ncbi:MAG: M20 family metallopeptidase [Defluviitaleaceae bacterium]|nr:M20 family metallopeptidase [Defluviitaleaceae bacterium]
MKDQLKTIANALKPDLCQISDFMYHHPELGNREYQAVQKLTAFLTQNGFAVTSPVLDMDTAFVAVYDTGRPGPSVAFICEYDALPEIGHACGHNMIGAMSAGAGVMLSKMAESAGNLSGKIYVFGTPAEETNGGKVAMADAGLFNGITAAMMLHPSSITQESGASAAMEALQFSYKGLTAHAAGCPEKGINALNAVIQLFNGTDALRQHVTPDVRIHGIISKGGVAANIVPDEAAAQFYIRAATKETLATVKEKVLNIAQGAALMTGATLDVSNYELSYDDLKTNPALSDAFNKNLRSLGITDIEPAKRGAGSSDIGNVSNVIPTIHPSIAICKTPLAGHTREFADATITDFAHDRLLIGALALACTGLDVLTGEIAPRQNT